jgi:hypothetical protein
MCDYSLELTLSRPARVGDELVSTRFPHSSTRGFAAADDTERSVAVCIKPGTELAFAKEVEHMTASFFKPTRSTGHKVARFREINRWRRHAHHDALEFPDGQIVLLTQLCEGQHATVLQLPAEASDFAAQEAEQHEPSAA